MLHGVFILILFIFSLYLYCIYCNFILVLRGYHIACLLSLFIIANSWPFILQTDMKLTFRVDYFKILLQGTVMEFIITTLRVRLNMVVKDNENDFIETSGQEIKILYSSKTFHWIMQSLQFSPRQRRSDQARTIHPPSPVKLSPSSDISLTTRNETHKGNESPGRKYKRIVEAPEEKGEK